MADQPLDPNASVEPDVDPNAAPGGGQDVDPDAVDEDGDDDDDAGLSDAERHQKDINKRNKENKSLRDRLRQTEKDLAAAKDKAAKFDELTDKEKSELVRLTERAEKAEARLAEKEQEDNRKAVGEEWGLTAKQLKWIKGSTLEELRESAEEYAEDNGIEKPAKESKSKTTKVVVKADDVKGRQTGEDTRTPAELAAAIPRRR